MITMDNYEGWLMRYADGELAEDERREVERFLDAHPGLREELEEVCSVKVTPVVATLPGKERLLRKEAPAFAWWRVAASVALLLAVGTTLLLVTGKPGEQPMMAMNGPVPVASPQQVATPTAPVKPLQPILPTKPIRPTPSVSPVPTSTPDAGEPLLAQEAVPQPLPDTTEEPRVEESPAPAPLPPATVTVVPVIEDARLAVNPWIEALTASR